MCYLRQGERTERLQDQQREDQDEKSQCLRPGVWKIRMKPVALEHKLGYKPTQASRYPIPCHHQEGLSEHLKLIREEHGTKDDDPRDAIN